MSSIYSGIPLESWGLGFLIAFVAPVMLYYLIHYVRHGRYGQGSAREDHPIGFIIGAIECGVGVGLTIFYLVGGYFFPFPTYLEGMIFTFSLFGIPAGLLTMWLTHKVALAVFRGESASSSGNAEHPTIIGRKEIKDDSMKSAVAKTISCPYCEAQNDSEDKYCRKCGSKI